MLNMRQNQMNSHGILKNICNEDLAVQEEVINIQHVCAKCHKFKKKTNSIYCYNCLGLR